MISTRAATGKAQFINAAHSPILLTCLGAQILAFDVDAIPQPQASGL